MKIGDIVVYTQKAPRSEFPENVRDGVVVDIAPNNIYVRPYNCKCNVCFNPNELRVILPGRLRESKKVQPSKPKKSKIENEFQTYMDWKVAGRYVRKGERYMKRNEDGECLFHRSQTNCSVTEQPRTFKRNWSRSIDDEMYEDSITEPTPVRTYYSDFMGGRSRVTEYSDGTTKSDYLGMAGEDDVPCGISLGM
jgi:hypothetical protein